MLERSPFMVAIEARNSLREERDVAAIVKFPIFEVGYIRPQGLNTGFNLFPRVVIEEEEVV
jgi:hypothetical protein